jgi:histone H2A
LFLLGANLSKKSTKAKPIRTELKAGIVFPVARIRRHLRDRRLAKRVGLGSSIYIAAVMEYLAAEVCELAGNIAKAKKVRRIVPRHILLAIK